MVHDLSLADIRARAVPPDARPALAQAPLDGTADLTGRATGTTDAPVFSGTVTATHGRLGPIAFARAQGDVIVTRGGLSSPNLVLQNGPARYRLSGGLTFDPPSAVDIRLEAEDVDAQWLSAALTAAPEMTGTLSGDLTLNGPLTAATVAGQVALDRGRVSRQRIDHAEAHLTPEAGRIRIAEAEARVNGSRLHAAGTLDPGGPIDLRVWAENLRPVDITAALGLSFPAEGGLALSRGGPCASARSSWSKGPPATGCPGRSGPALIQPPASRSISTTGRSPRSWPRWAFRCPRRSAAPSMGGSSSPGR